MSNFLIIYVDENINFDANVTKQAIFNINNAKLSISKNEYSEGFIKYKFDEHEININIAKDWKFLGIESSGNAGIDFAIQLNKQLDANLFLTDSTYSFLCKLNKIDSLEDIKNTIKQGIYMNE